MRMRGNKPLFSRRDTWSLDATLAPIIAAGLKKFLEVVQDPQNVGGCPICYLKDYPGHEYTDKQMKEACERWYADLREMIWAFENQDDDANIYADRYLSSLEFVECEPTVVNGVEMRASTIKSDETLERYYNWANVCCAIRRKRGMQLFVDRFKDLWW